MPTHTERLTNFLRNLFFNIFLLILFGFLFLVLMALISIPIDALASQIKKHTDICADDDVDDFCLQTMGFLSLIVIIFAAVSPFLFCYYVAHRLDKRAVQNIENGAYHHPTETAY